MLSDEIKKIAKEVQSSEKKFWAEVYEEDEAHWTDKEVSKLTKSIVKKYGSFKNILEIGCAAGIDTFYLAKYTNNKIIGIDIISDIINQAVNLKKQSKNLQNKITFEIGDAEKLKYDNESFDFVYSLSVLHTTDINKSLSEINRVLTKNGNAVIYIFIDEELNKNKFLDICKKYFNINQQEIVSVKHDDGGDKHKALITYLEKIK